MMYPEIVRIHKTVDETKNIKTILFPFTARVEPGQFFMILIPGMDEIPMSVSYISKEYKGFTFKRVGDATTELFHQNKGDMLGVRGPLGKGFSFTGKKILFVGGGTGVACITPAVEKALSQGLKAAVVIGARTKEELFFVDRLKKTGAEFHPATDDGSYGHHGFASDVAEKLLEKTFFDLIITCGPELMMKKVVDLCNEKHIKVQASLERYIKCGVGLCGHCCIGEGLRVCRDGPVFDGKTLVGCKDFSVFKRDATGRKVYFG